MKDIALLYDTSSHNGTIITTNQDNKFWVGPGTFEDPFVGVGEFWGDFMFGDPPETTAVRIMKPVVVNGALHSCPQYYGGGSPHGVTAITAVTTKSYCNGKLIVTYGAVAGCGAIITPADRQVHVE